MPIVPSVNTSAFEPLRRYEPPPKEAAPTYFDIGRAAIEQENDIYALYKMEKEKAFPMQDGFNLTEAAKKRGVDARNFTEVLSEDELDYRISKRQREEDNKKVLEAGGWTGYAAMLGAGLISPTTFIPFLRAEKGVSSVLMGAASIFGGAAAQEAMLYASQETRTKGEVGFSLAASTIIGGLLGAAAHTMSKSVVDKIAHDMVNSPKEPTIHEPMPFGGDLGAKENDTILKDAGKLRKGWGADKLAFMSPITRGFQQWNAPSYIKGLGGSAEMRKMTAGFSQAGLSLEGNASFKAAVAGGNVEDLKRSYGVVSYLGRKLVDDNYIEYILGKDAGGIAKKSRAILAGTRADGKLNYNEFKRQITLDIWSNFTRENVDPQVRKAAKAIDEKVYKKMYDEGVEVGLFTGEEKTIGDENYANRVYNNEVIMRRHEEFVKILAKNLSTKYEQDFSKEFEKLRERMLKDKATLDDINRPLDEVLALREQIKAKAQQLETQTSLDVLEGVDAIKEIKSEVRNLTKELEDLKATKIDGADVEGFRRRKDRMDEIEAALKSKALQSEGIKKALGEGLDNYTKELGEVRRRLANLSQATALKDQRLARKLEKIERNEDAQIATILRAQKQLQKFIKMLDSATDKKLDAEITKLKNAFAENSAKFDKYEKERFKLEEAGDIPIDGGDGSDGNNPPPKPPKDTPPKAEGGTEPPKVEPPPVEPPAPVLSKVQEERVDDIVISNIESAFDTVDSYDNIDDALRAHEQNIYDTIREEFPKNSPERKLAEDRAANKISESFNKYQRRYDELKTKEDWVKPRSELFNASKRDMHDAGLTKPEMEEVLKDPAKYENMLDLIKRGYHNFKGIFRQVKQADADAAEKAATDFDYLTRQDALFKAYEGLGPEEKLAGVVDPASPPKTRKEALAELDAKYEELTSYRDKLSRAVEKAWKYPDPEIVPTYVDPPVLPPVTGDPLTNKLHPDLSVAVGYFRNVNQAIDWFEKYGESYERVLAQRLRGLVGNAAFYVVDPKGIDPAYHEFRQAIGDSRGRFWRDLYEPPVPGGRITARLLIRKNSANRGTIMHELLHAATVTKVDLGRYFPQKYPKLAKLYKDLEDIRIHVRNLIQADEAITGIKVPFYVNYSVHNVHEVIANALTNKEVIAFYKKIKYKNQTVYSKFVSIVREILGIPKTEENAFSAVLDLTDRMLKESEGVFDTKPSPLRVDPEARKGIIVAQEGVPGESDFYKLNANFRAWFDGSQVVTEDGSPRVMYHGTSKDTDFSKFTVGKRGAFFTTDRVSASEYAMQNDSMKTVMGPGWKFENKNTASRVMPVYLSVKKPYKLSAAELDAYATDPRGYVVAQREIADRAKAAGYDGVDYGGGVWVVFEPTQIKSAIGNGGKFDPKKPEINDQPKMGEDPAFKLADKMDKISAKMDELAGKLDDLENFDRAAWRAEIEDMMWELADTHAKINAKRVVRNEKLWKDVEKLSPEARQKKIDAFKLKAADRPKDFVSRWNTRAKGDLMQGNANFDEYSEDIARQTVKKILGSERRLAYSDIIQAERGPELARTLNIPSEQIADFLETDIEKLISIYTRTVGSDLAIARVFGSADAAEAFQKLNDERQLMLKKIETLTGKDGKPLSKEEQEQLQYDTHKFYDAGQKDLMVLMERAKGMRGLPRDPDSASARMAKTAMDLNYLRFMGGVVVNSVADVARPIMKYGLTRTFRDGIIPMIRAFKLIRMSQREARLAGTALDMVMHTRAHSMMDVFDDAYRGTTVEKGIHYLSTRMGAIALFDQWTVAMKEFTAGIANAKLLDSIAIVNGEPASAKEIAKAQEFLARNNIDAEIATTIWSQVTNGKGGGKINGVWLPNTEKWDVADPQVARAQRAYRAALGGEIDSTIITPGFERPNWVDSSVPARMLAQFKSFGLSSVQKTLMAGMQEHDAAFLNGVIASLGLGMLSYYLWATAAGGDAQEKMNKAIANGDWGVWADEAIARSGVLGVVSDAQKYAHRIPVLRDYTTFSGGDTTRRAGGDLTETVLGPSFDLLEKAHGLVTGIDEPTKQTLHTARQLLPLQNVFYLRQLLDKIENSIDLPEKRAQ